MPVNVSSRTPRQAARGATPREPTRWGIHEVIKVLTLHS